MPLKQGLSCQRPLNLRLALLSKDQEYNVELGMYCPSAGSQLWDTFHSQRQNDPPFCSQWPTF